MALPPCGGGAQPLIQREGMAVVGVDLLDVGLWSAWIFGKKESLDLIKGRQPAREYVKGRVRASSTVSYILFLKFDICQLSK